MAPDPRENGQLDKTHGSVGLDSNPDIASGHGGQAVKGLGSGPAHTGNNLNELTPTPTFAPADGLQTGAASELSALAESRTLNADTPSLAPPLTGDNSASSNPLSRVENSENSENSASAN